MLRDDRAGQPERAQPRELIGEVAKAFAKEDAGLDRVGRVRADASGARTADTPRHSGRDQGLMQTIAINLAFECQVGGFKPGSPKSAPIAVKPAAVNSERESWREQARERPIESVVADIAALRR